MQKLFINNQECDIFQGSIRITKQAYDFTDLQKRYIGRSNQFTLPKTQTNIMILGNPSALGSTNRPFERKHIARIEDGYILLTGIAIIEESNGEFKVQVIEDSKIFFEAAKENLNQLDFDSEDIVYNAATFAVLNNPTSSVWLWGIHSAHTNKKATNTAISGNLAFTRPWFNLAVITQKIFDKHGWSFDKLSEFDEFNQGILSSNHEAFYVTSYQKTLNTSYVAGNITGLDSNDFEKNVTTTSTTIDVGDTTTSVRIRGNVTTTSDMTLRVQALSSPSGTDQVDELFVIGENDTYIDFETAPISTDENSNVIQIILVGTGTVTFDNTLLYTKIEESDLGGFKFDNLQGYKVKVFDNLPNIDQYDLIVTNIMVMFGAAFNTDSFNKKLKVFSFDKFNKFNSYDWSKKFIEDSETIKPIKSNYGQTNFLQYENDDLTFESIGRDQFIINNDNISKEEVLTNLAFSASTQVTIAGFQLLDMAVYNDDERVGSASPRIGYYYDSGGSTYVNFTPLKWSELSSKYYSRIIPSLQRARFIEASFDLNKLDVIGFDFEKCVYIKKLEGHYLVLNIADYVEGQPTKCNLLKLE